LDFSRRLHLRAKILAFGGHSSEAGGENQEKADQRSERHNVVERKDYIQRRGADRCDIVSKMQDARNHEQETQDAHHAFAARQSPSRPEGYGRSQIDKRAETIPEKKRVWFPIHSPYGPVRGSSRNREGDPLGDPLQIGDRCNPQPQGRNRTASQSEEEVDDTVLDEDLAQIANRQR
jgi:hypothetical protein